MECQHFVFYVSFSLLLASVAVICSPVVYLEKHVGSKSQPETQDVDVGTPWESCSKSTNQTIPRASTCSLALQEHNISGRCVEIVWCEFSVLWLTIERRWFWVLTYTEASLVPRLLPVFQCCTPLPFFSVQHWKNWEEPGDEAIQKPLSFVWLRYHKTFFLSLHANEIFKMICLLPFVLICEDLFSFFPVSEKHLWCVTSLPTVLATSTVQ